MYSLAKGLNVGWLRKLFTREVTGVSHHDDNHRRNEGNQQEEVNCYRQGGENREALSE